MSALLTRQETEQLFWIAVTKGSVVRLNELAGGARFFSQRKGDPAAPPTVERRDCDLNHSTALSVDEQSDDDRYWSSKAFSLIRDEFNGDTALHLAVRMRHIAVIRWLLAETPIATDALNLSGRMALHVAIENCDTEAAKLLLDTIPLAVTRCFPPIRFTELKETLAETAARCDGSGRLVELVVLAGVDPLCSLSCDEAAAEGGQATVGLAKDASAALPKILKGKTCAARLLRCYAICRATWCSSAAGVALAESSAHRCNGAPPATELSFSSPPAVGSGLCRTPASVELHQLWWSEGTLLASVH